MQMVFSGHHHQDYRNIINGIKYIQINSMSYHYQRTRTTLITVSRMKKRSNIPSMEIWPCITNLFGVRSRCLRMESFKFMVGPHRSAEGHLRNSECHGTSMVIPLILESRRFAFQLRNANLRWEKCEARGDRILVQQNINNGHAHDLCLEGEVWW